MNQDSHITPATVQAVIAEHRGWFIALGILLIALGIAAIAFPLVTTIAVKIALGWVFLIVGLAQIFHAFSTKSWSQFFLNFLVGLLYAIAGAWLAFLPLSGIVTLTVLLAVMFLLGGIIETYMALRLRPLEGWLWMAIAGLVAIAMGILLVAELPSSAAWAIGLLVGINIVSSGWAYLFLGLAAGKKA